VGEVGVGLLLRNSCLGLLKPQEVDASTLFLHRVVHIEEPYVKSKFIRDEIPRTGWDGTFHGHEGPNLLGFLGHAL
jgi:hypothetical protein